MESCIEDLAQRKLAQKCSSKEIRYESIMLSGSASAQRTAEFGQGPEGRMHAYITSFGQGEMEERPCMEGRVQWWSLTAHLLAAPWWGMQAGLSLQSTQLECRGDRCSGSLNGRVSSGKTQGREIKPSECWRIGTSEEKGEAFFFFFFSQKTT